MNRCEKWCCILAHPLTTLRQFNHCVLRPCRKLVIFRCTVGKEIKELVGVVLTKDEGEHIVEVMGAVKRTSAVHLPSLVKYVYIDGRAPIITGLARIEICYPHGDIVPRPLPCGLLFLKEVDVSWVTFSAWT